MNTGYPLCRLLSIVCLLVWPATTLAATVQAVASFTILADVVRAVGGDRVAVTSLVPPDGDPHRYSPKPRDSRTLRAADVSFISGDGLEDWFARLARAAGAPPPVVVSRDITTYQVDEGGQAITDPHVWNDVANVRRWVETIRDALIDVDAAGAPAYRRRAARYDARLEALDSAIRQALTGIPRERRQVLTDHDAFGYYARAYDVTFRAPAGVSTDSEPSARAMARLIDQVRAHDIAIYFIENSSDARRVEQIARATGARPGGTLYPESLSTPDGPAPNYIALMRHNTDLIVRALKTASR